MPKMRKMRKSTVSEPGPNNYRTNDVPPQRTYLRRKCKSRRTSSNQVAQSDSVADGTRKWTIHDVPPEILERILDNLEGKDLLNSRLVNSQWKAMLNRIMEQKLLSFFTSWHTETNYSNLDLDTLIPALWIKSNHKNPVGKTRTKEQALAIKLLNSLPVPADGVRVRVENYSKLFSSRGIFGKGSQNPFPSSSLRFGTSEFQHKAIRDGKVEIYQFFKDYGHFLTTLVLDGYRVHASEFAKLLSHLPNLKSLTLENVRLYGNESFKWNASTLPPLQHLTHLRCDSFGHNFDIMLSPRPYLWIFEKYGDQLVGLTVSGRPFLSWDYFRKLKKNIQFAKLKQLTVDSSNAAILKLTQGAMLSHIMLRFYLRAENNLQVMFPWIESFSETLEYLWLPNKTRDIVQNDGTLMNFPKVKELLAIRGPSPFVNCWD